MTPKTVFGVIFTDAVFPLICVFQNKAYSRPSAFFLREAAAGFPTLPVHNYDSLISCMCVLSEMKSASQKTRAGMRMRMLKGDC